MSGLTDGDICRLDDFEGSEYERRKVTISLLEHARDRGEKGELDGEHLVAETYVWIAPKRFLQNEEWDFADFQKEKMHRWVRDGTEILGTQSGFTLQATHVTFCLLFCRW